MDGVDYLAFLADIPPKSCAHSDVDNLDFSTGSFPQDGCAPSGLFFQRLSSFFQQLFHLPFGDGVVPYTHASGGAFWAMRLEAGPRGGTGARCVGTASAHRKLARLQSRCEDDLVFDLLQLPSQMVRSAFIFFSTALRLLSTVEWSRPPNSAPMAGVVHLAQAVGKVDRHVPWPVM